MHIDALVQVIITIQYMLNFILNMLIPFKSYSPLKYENGFENDVYFYYHKQNEILSFTTYISPLFYSTSVLLDIICLFPFSDSIIWLC